VASTALATDLILGRYRALRPLGSGGMGHVWLARDERNGLDVALKMVVREGRVAERAEREARAAAALRHPRCQRIYALARDSTHIYIAYEYVPGRTLRHALDAHELTDEEAVEAAAQVLDALAHAHRKGIIHRDVKPSNVLLAESDGIDMRLLDFGLAQMAEFDTLTAVGDVPGTLTYVSPERLAGETATAAADVWGVGVMLWEALAGRHPFRSSNAEGTSRRIRAGAPPLETIRPDLPAAVLAAVASALDSDPEQRPSAGRLATELRGGQRKRKRVPGQVEQRPPSEAPQARMLGLAKERLAPAVAAAAWTGWVASVLPLSPAGWPVGLTIAAAALGFVFPRAAFAFALTVTFFPLANISFGLAVLFAVLGAAWIALTWTDPRGNIALVLAPLLGPLAGLALLPIAAQFARGPTRRAVQAASGALLAVLVAGLRHEKLPFAGVPAPLGLGITGSNRPSAVAFALWRPLEAHPVVLGQAAVLAAAAVALPYLRGRGPWIAAGAGAALLAATALGAPESPFVPLAAAALITAAFLVGTEPATTPPATVSTSERSGPTRKRDSLFRRRETVPTFSPEGL
jgi:eukaryotic-like serine/threonine-protein kinase